jgi:hypothetical protein
LKVDYNQITKKKKKILGVSKFIQWEKFHHSVFPFKLLKNGNQAWEDFVFVFLDEFLGVLSWF